MVCHVLVRGRLECLNYLQSADLILHLSKFQVMYFALIVPKAFSIISPLECLACLKTTVVHSVCILSDNSSSRIEYFFKVSFLCRSLFYFFGCEVTLQCLSEFQALSTQYFLEVFLTVQKNPHVVLLSTQLFPKKCIYCWSLFFRFVHEITLRLVPINQLLMHFFNMIYYLIFLQHVEMLIQDILMQIELLLPGYFSFPESTCLFMIIDFQMTFYYFSIRSMQFIA